MTKVSAAPRLEGGHVCSLLHQVLLSAWHSWELHQSSTLKTILLHWSCLVSLEPPEQAKAPSSSNHPYFPSLPQFSPALLPSLTSKARGEKLYLLLSDRRAGKFAGTKEIQDFKVTAILKYILQKKETSVLVFRNDRAQFSYFCREDYTHQGRAIPTWEFLYRHIIEEAASGINSTHYQGTDR